MPQDPAEVAARLRALEKEMAVRNVVTNVDNNPLATLGRSAPVRFGLSALGKTLDVLDTGLNLTTMALRPLITEYNPDLNKVYERYKNDTGAFGVPNITPSALIEDAIPGRSIYKSVLKFGSDVALDPLTYLTFGTETTAGRILSKTKGLAKAKETIKLDSKLAQEISNLYGEGKPTVDLIRRAKQEAVIPKTLAQQAKVGERALVNLDIPFGPKIPLVKGAPAFEALDVAKQAVKANQYGKAFNAAFSTHTSNPAFDEMRQNFTNLLQYRKGEVIATAKTIDTQLDEIATKFGIPRDRVDRIVTDLVERPSLVRKITKKVVTRIAPEGTEIKEKLVTALRGIGESKAADFWEKQSVFSKELQDLIKESKVPNSPIAKFMERAPVYEQISQHLEPLKRLAEDVNYFNASAPAKDSFVRGLFWNLNIAPGEIPHRFNDYNRWEINPVSKLLKEAYKRGADKTDRELAQVVAEHINEELILNRTTVKDLFDDIFREIPIKLPTTKPSRSLVQGEFMIGKVPQTTISKLAKKLETKYPTPESQLIYYGTHFYRPQRIQSVAMHAEEIHYARQGLEANRGFQALRRGQLADILKQNRGDVYDRMSFLVNQGVIENRDILPGKSVENIINGKTLYNEKEVLVKHPTVIMPEGSKLVTPEGLRHYSVIPRGEFEREISEAKQLIYDTKQILPVVHGTNTFAMKKILESGILAAEDFGSGTHARDIAAGLRGTIFASTPRSNFGQTKIILPVSFLEKATALPGDGLYLPANKMITQYLLSRGQEAIVDMLVRTMALNNWREFKQFKIRMINNEELSHLFADQLDVMSIHPDVHLTGPIDPKTFLKVLHPEDASVAREYEALSNIGIDISKLQLTQKNGRFFTRFYDRTGNPILDHELLATPNLADALSRANLVGVGVDAEKQAAAIEKFIAKAKIPEGESIFTYLRKSKPSLFAKQIDVGDTAAFDKIMDNYGLLSDESLNAIAVNILDVREGAYAKGLSAQEVLESPIGQLLNKKIVINQDNFQKAVQAIPGYALMPLEEKGKLTRELWRQVKAHERGHDVFTLGLRILPDELQHEFADIAARATHLDILRTAGKKPINEEKLSGILRAFSTGGEDAAVEHLVGKTAFKALKKTPLDYEFMKSVVHKLVSHTDEMFSEAHSMYMMNPKGLQRRWPEAYGVMRKIYQRKGWKTEWITENTRIPRPLAEKYPEMFDIANTVRRVQHEYLEREVDAGVKGKVFTGDTEYTRHVITREVRDFLRTKYFKGARVWTDEHQAQIMRKFRNILPDRVNDILKSGEITPLQASKLRKKNSLEYLDSLVEDGTLSREKANGLIHWLTIDEVNALGRAGKLKIMGGIKVDKFFDDNPVMQVKVRGIEGERARTGAEFFQSSKQFGAFQKEILPGYKQVKPEALRGWQFPEDVADHIDRYYETTKLPLGVHPFVDAFDNIQDAWKAWTLAIFPAYHTRNLVGNAWNNFLAGLVNPRYYYDARNVMQGKAHEVVTGYGKKYATDEIIDLMKQHDLWKVGQYGRDVEGLFERELKKASFAAKSRDNSILNAGRSVGIYLETNSYMAHFIWRLEQGYSPAAAAQSVKKYLFDYSDLTPFEKSVMKRVFPFYTWTRKNVPLQLEALVTQPRKALGVLKSKYAYESNQDGVPDERYLPDWMVQNFPIRARKDAKTGQFEYFLLGSWLPLADIDKIFRPDRLVMNMLTPLLKEPMQQILNKDAFYGKEIDQGGEYERLVGLNMPKRLSHLLKNIRVLNEADKLTKTDLSTEAKITGIMTGKLYPLDIKKERKYRKLKEEEQDRNLSSQLNRAQKKRDKGEVERVIKLIKKTKMDRAKSKLAGAQGG